MGTAWLASTVVIISFLIGTNARRSFLRSADSLLSADADAQLVKTSAECNAIQAELVKARTHFKPGTIQKSTLQQFLKELKTACTVNGDVSKNTQESAYKADYTAKCTRKAGVVTQMIHTKYGGTFTDYIAREYPFLARPGTVQGSDWTCKPSFTKVKLQKSKPMGKIVNKGTCSLTSGPNLDSLGQISNWQHWHNLAGDACNAAPLFELTGDALQKGSDEVHAKEQDESPVDVNPFPIQMCAWKNPNIGASTCGIGPANKDGLVKKCEGEFYLNRNKYLTDLKEHHPWETGARIAFKSLMMGLNIIATTAGADVHGTPATVDDFTKSWMGGIETAFSGATSDGFKSGAGADDIALTLGALDQAGEAFLEYKDIQAEIKAYRDCVHEKFVANMQNSYVQQYDKSKKKEEQTPAEDFLTQAYQNDPCAHLAPWCVAQTDKHAATVAQVVDEKTEDGHEPPMKDGCSMTESLRVVFRNKFMDPDFLFAMADTSSKFIAVQVTTAAVVTSLNLATGGVAPFVLLAANIVGQVLEFGCGHFHSKMVEISSCLDKELFKLGEASFAGDFKSAFKVSDKTKIAYVDTFNGIAKHHNDGKKWAWGLDTCAKVGRFLQSPIGGTLTYLKNALCTKTCNLSFQKDGGAKTANEQRFTAACRAATYDDNGVAYQCKPQREHWRPYGPKVRVKMKCKDTPHAAKCFALPKCVPTAFLALNAASRAPKCDEHSQDESTCNLRNLALKPPSSGHFYRCSWSERANTCLPVVADYAKELRENKPYLDMHSIKKIAGSGLPYQRQ